MVRLTVIACTALSPVEVVTTMFAIRGAVVLSGINHLLVPAKTGDVSEYGTLPDRTISPEVATKIAAWLKALPTK